MNLYIVFLLFVFSLTTVFIDFVTRLSFSYLSYNECLNMTSNYHDIKTHIYILSSTSSAEVLVKKNYQIEYIQVRKFYHKEYSYRFLCPYL